MNLASDLRALENEKINGTITAEAYEARKNELLDAMVDAIEGKYYSHRGDGRRPSVIRGVVTDVRPESNYTFVILAGGQFVYLTSKYADAIRVGDRLVVAGYGTQNGFFGAHRNETTGYDSSVAWVRAVRKTVGIGLALFCLALLDLIASIRIVVSGNHGWAFRSAIAVGLVGGGLALVLVAAVMALSATLIWMQVKALRRSV